MAETEKTTETTTTKTTEKAATAAVGDVQKQVDEEQRKGYFGTEADPTPDHAYTVAGVTSGEPTPETDPDAAETAARNTGTPIPPKAASQEKKA